MDLSNKPIKTGAFGPIVKSIQTFLLGAGYGLGAADGQFGLKTHSAVLSYQTAEGLKADGIVGNLTLGRMLAQGFVLMPTPDNDESGAYPPGFPLRPNFAPLTTNAARAQVFGTFDYVPAPEPGNPEAIRITNDWDDRNIVLTVIPQLKKRGLSQTGNARMHRLVEQQTLALWLAWEIEGLLDLVLSWEGMYVPRFVRGSRSTLSNHAFGSAFDINAGTNGLGRTPVAVGTRGSVRELVPTAHKFGFYWGGHFSRADGMHFEVSQVMTPEAVAETLTNLNR